MPAPRCLRFACVGLTAWALPLFAADTKPVASPVTNGYTGPIPADDIDLDAHIAEAQFDTTTTPLPINVPSLGFHTAATSEFGDLVHLSGATHFIESVTITMSSRAIRSDYPGAAVYGFNHPVTLTLYSVDRSTGEARPGRSLASVTTSFLMPWRPEADATLPPSPLRPWRGPDGQQYSGVAFNLTFDLGRLSLALPEEVIFGVAFNTQHHGAKPLGVPGPYDALHVGVTSTPPVTGADFSPGAVYWKTADGRLYADGGAGGVNTFRRDTGWGRYAPAVRFNNSAYGTLADALGRLEALTSTDATPTRALTEARGLVKSALDRKLWESNRQVRSLWGRLVFDLIAEAADELAPVESGRGPLATKAQDVVTSLINVAESLAESALGDAIVGAGDASRIARAQDSIDAAAPSLPAAAIDEFGNAWREAQLALR